MQLYKVRLMLQVCKQGHLHCQTCIRVIQCKGPVCLNPYAGGG